MKHHLQKWQFEFHRIQRASWPVLLLNHATWWLAGGTGNLSQFKDVQASRQNYLSLRFSDTLSAHTPVSETHKFTTRTPLKITTYDISFI